MTETQASLNCCIARRCKICLSWLGLCSIACKIWCWVRRAWQYFPWMHVRHLRAAQQITIRVPHQFRQLSCLCDRAGQNHGISSGPKHFG